MEILSQTGSPGHSGGAPVITLGELLPVISREHAAAWVGDWLGGVSGWAVVTRISSAGRHIVRSWAFQVPALLDMIEHAPGFETLCMDDGGRWNVYVGCSTHREDPTDGGKRRGGRSTVQGVHGVWLDLDVKNESFAGGGSEIDAFLRELPVRPSLVVGSGSGGRHAYWRFSEGSLSGDDGEKVLEAWWALAQERAGDVYIDKITTSDRIMRLPGTVRWPKIQGEGMGQVQVLSRGARVRISELWDASESAWQRLEARRATTREAWQNRGGAAGLRLGDLASKAGWEQLYALAYVEEIFNETISWDTILVPYGWVYVGSDTEGRRHWARPGQRGKSAHTDYPPSPWVMNLFSNSPETGLAELKDADVPLTKFRVYCQLAYNGDTDRLIEAILLEQDHRIRGDNGNGRVQG